MNLPEAEAEEGRLTASDIVLMFAGEFAETQEDGYQAPCSEAQVKLTSLVREMLTTAFVSLAKSGIIQMKIGKQKRLFSERQTLFVTRAGDPSVTSGGLEGAILAHLTSQEGQDSVRYVIGRVVGSTTIEPYSAIVEISTENACRAGYFRQQERTGTAAFLGKRTLPRLFEPLCDRISSLVGRVHEVQEMRQDFEIERSELYGMLRQDVEKSVRSAYFRT